MKIKGRYIKDPVPETAYKNSVFIKKKCYRMNFSLIVIRCVKDKLRHTDKNLKKI